MALLPKVDRMIRRIIERLRHPRKRHTAPLPVPTKPTTIATASPPLATLISTSTKKEKAEPDTRSRLELLPAEIRLIIYEYARTNDTPLLCVQSPHHRTTKRHLLHAKSPCRSLNLSHYPSAEFNTLKHVSRLFYAETAGLELRYNTLLFRGSHSTSCLQRFFDFYTSCLSKKDRKKVRKVHIKHSKKIAQDSYSRRRVVRISLDTTRTCTCSQHFSDATHTSQSSTRSSASPPGSARTSWKLGLAYILRRAEGILRACLTPGTRGRRCGILI
jgi:hypothetical protein